jgi:hypothetical protein
VAGVTTIDQTLGGPLVVALFDLTQHRGELTRVAANVNHNSTKSNCRRFG